MIKNPLKGICLQVYNIMWMNYLLIEIVFHTESWFNLLFFSFLLALQKYHRYLSEKLSFHNVIG